VSLPVSDWGSQQVYGGAHQELGKTCVSPACLPLADTDAAGGPLGGAAERARLSRRRRRGGPAATPLVVGNLVPRFLPRFLLVAPASDTYSDQASSTGRDEAMTGSG
jgi:hypothetical protein